MSAKKPQPKLTDVARDAGVSPATVSRVLHNTTHVRDSVRSRVLKSVSSLGYEPLPLARANKQIASIAILIPDILNPYFTEVMRGVQDEASLDRYLPVLLDTAEDAQNEQKTLRMLVGQSLEGIITVGSRILSQEISDIHQQLQVPMVLINRSMHLPNVACIRVDFESATYRAARHLIALNHTRLAYLPGPATSESSQTRRRGIEKALQEVNLTLRPDLCPPSQPNVDGGFEAMSALLALPTSQRPTAIIVYNDIMALGVLHAIRVHHLRVPEDISVIGIDDIAMAAHTNPPLTTIAQPKYRMGRLAMKTLRRMIEGQTPPEESYTLMESPLIMRETTAHAPTGESTS